NLGITAQPDNATTENAAEPPSQLLAPSRRLAASCCGWYHGCRRCSSPVDALRLSRRASDLVCVCSSAKGGCHALASSDCHYCVRGSYVAFYSAEPRPRYDVLSRLQRSRASRNSNCGRLRSRRRHGRQPVCAIASILQRLATQPHDFVLAQNVCFW